MRYARPNRHYRVGKQESKVNSLKGTFVSNNDKPKIAAACGLIGMLIFIIGLLTGVLVDKD